MIAWFLSFFYVTKSIMSMNYLLIFKQIPLKIFAESVPSVHYFIVPIVTCRYNRYSSNYFHTSRTFLCYHSTFLISNAYPNNLEASRTPKIHKLSKSPRNISSCSRDYYVSRERGGHCPSRLYNPGPA